MNRSLGPGLLPRERSPGVHPQGMPGWITEKPDGSDAVWKIEGESGSECPNQFKTTKCRQFKRFEICLLHLAKV